MLQWLETFIKELGKMIMGPPYLVYLFISPVLVIVSLWSDRFFEYTWALLIFSIVGAMWRHIEKDIDSQLTKWMTEKYGENKELKLRIKLIIVVIYQTVNIALLAGLVIYLVQLEP